MHRAGIYFNGTFLDEVKTSTVTPGVRELQAIGGGQYIRGRAGPATIAIALTRKVRKAIETADKRDHVALMTEDRAIYWIVDRKVVGWVLYAALAFQMVAPDVG
jgi:hypothetical protein